MKREARSRAGPAGLKSWVLGGGAVVCDSVYGWHTHLYNLLIVVDVVVSIAWCRYRRSASLPVPIQINESHFFSLSLRENIPFLQLNGFRPRNRFNYCFSNSPSEVPIADTQ